MSASGDSRAGCSAKRFAVVGEAADADGALREVARLRPDVVLLDVVLPDRFATNRRSADAVMDRLQAGYRR
jgi:DNA-binding NarL/FixJ family response regulator